MMANKLQIGIIGHGFVGKAVEYGFDTKKVEKYIVDPNYGTTVETMFENMVPDIAFIAVPTPMGSDGAIDSSIIEDVFHSLKNANRNTIAVVKSTITPAIVQKLESIYPRVVYNPEFLTERNAADDFVNAPMLVLGGRNTDDLEYINWAYIEHSKCVPCPVHYTDLEGASMVKYTLNCFLSTKVLFFNQMNDVFNKSGTKMTWDGFLDIIRGDERIGDSHMSVPGPDGRRGYGGACFPKDTTAMKYYAESLGVPFTQLHETIRANQEIRKQYTDLDAREKEQNVNFDILK